MLFGLLLCSVAVSATLWDGITPWFSDSTCNCNGYSEICFYDQKLYEETGHGGHCLNCKSNRDGPNCERCRDNYYLTNEGECLPCYCNEVGSRDLQCNSNGMCNCKHGVTGDKCNQCALDYYDFSVSGCKECNCMQAGSLNNEPNCDQAQGKCMCKENVEGKECDKCKPGFFNLDEFNEFGCTPCFCYGHSPNCQPATGYSKVWIESMFARNNEKWTALDNSKHAKILNYNSNSQDISVNATGRENVYFIAPEKYLGDQRGSYNQDLQFKLRVGEQGSAPSVEDIILEGHGRQVTQTIFGQANESPGTTATFYKFILHEHADYGWKPKMSSRDFISILSNLTSIKIRGTYTAKGTGFLDHVKLGTAARGAAGHAANWIEWCTCPVGYIGQFCESCAPGFRHEPPHGDSFSECVPCNCNSHADICDADTGRCICHDNTAGENCERCAHGYYGNALSGTSNDCQPCPCINNGACYQVDSTVICLECPKGYAGAQCDQCSDGYFGDLTQNNGTVATCQPCDCNTNVDLNAVNNCDRITGECLKCIYYTAGARCDQCLPGFFGDPLAPEKGDCKHCLCDTRGTEGGIEGPFLCNPVSGQCQCKSNIVGTNCDNCKTGYYDIESGEGCKPCNCNLTGSLDSSCDLQTGQCKCKEGVTGLQCDQCKKYHYGFSEEGCQQCECDPIGSLDLQCNATGHCPCLENVEGKNCDRCKENKYDKKRNCIDCPACYGLVQDEVNKHRESLSKLDTVLQNIKATPAIYHDKEFDDQVQEVTQMVEQLWQDAKRAVGDDSELGQNLEELRKKLKAMEETLKTVQNDAKSAEVLVDNADKNATAIRQIIDEAMSNIKAAIEHITLDGLFALARARNRSKEVGQKNEQMSEIAHQARTLVEKQLEEARQTEIAAKKALDICDKAHLLLTQAKDKQNNATRELETLGDKVEKAKTDMNKINHLSASIESKVSAAFQEAYNFAVEINFLAEPNVDAAKIRLEANDHRQRAERYEKEALSFEETYKNMTAGIENDLLKSNDNLTIAKKLQQDVDLLLARADAGLKKAQMAVELGEKTLKDAQETLMSLQDFDEKRLSGKQKALEALQSIPNIEELLKVAKEKTTNAKEALTGAESNAQAASTTAQMAQNKFAQEASMKAKEIRTKAEDAKNSAGKMLGVADGLSHKITQAGIIISNMKMKVDDNIDFAKKAKDKVGKAKNNADDASAQVKNAFDSLHLIEKELSDLTDIDEDTLNQLEKRLIDAEKDFTTANLDEKLQALTTSRINQQQLLKNYEEELARLEQEVNKVQRIQEALPQNCWKRNRLEI